MQHHSELFEKEKYEFLVITDFSERKYFDTKKESDDFVTEFRQKQKDLGVENIHARQFEGKDVRYQPICRMKYKYGGKIYDVQYKFDTPYPKESGIFYFTDGNYGCDCNRSLLLQRNNHLKDFPEEFDCGGKIKLVKIRMTYKKLY